MKLYKVKLRRMLDSYGISYVVATDPTNAYNMVKSFLDKIMIWGFVKNVNWIVLN
jgi:hypothetical protein